jgi:hypothetical protein
MLDFPQTFGWRGEYNLFWPQKCGDYSKYLNRGKDFDDNVEAHESTCDTWPASRAGASEHIRGTDDTGYEYERERARCHAASGYDHHFGPSYDWQVAGD